MNFESLRAQTTYLSPTIIPEEPLFEFGCFFTFGNVYDTRSTIYLGRDWSLLVCFVSIPCVKKDIQRNVDLPSKSSNRDGR